MNTIVAIWNSGGKGKSSTILELANLLINRFPSNKIIFCDKNTNNLTIDFRLIIEINGKTIALESQGDPTTKLDQRLDDIATKYNPNILFCTCRTRGETVQAIDDTANNFSYDIIWTSTYQTTHSTQLANQLKAEHLLDFIIKMGLL